MLPITQRSGSRVVEAPRRYVEAGAAPATRQYAGRGHGRGHGRGRLEEDGTDARLLSRRVRARACAELRAGQGDAREPPSQLISHQIRLGPPAGTAADTCPTQPRQLRADSGQEGRGGRCPTTHTERASESSFRTARAVTSRCCSSSAFAWMAHVEEVPPSPSTCATWLAGARTQTP